MKKIFASLLLCAFAFGTGAAADARGIEWQKLNDEARALYAQGLYERASEVAQKA